MYVTPETSSPPAQLQSFLQFQAVPSNLQDKPTHRSPSVVRLRPRQAAKLAAAPSPSATLVAQSQSICWQRSPGSTGAHKPGLCLARCSLEQRHGHISTAARYEQLVAALQLMLWTSNPWWEGLQGLQVTTTHSHTCMQRADVEPAAVSLSKGHRNGADSVS